MELLSPASPDPEHRPPLRPAGSLSILSIPPPPQVALLHTTSPHYTHLHTTSLYSPQPHTIYLHTTSQSSPHYTHLTVLTSLSSAGSLSIVSIPTSTSGSPPHHLTHHTSASLYSPHIPILTSLLTIPQKQSSCHYILDLHTSLL